MILLTIVSFLVLGGFMVYGVKEFGLLTSYSAYSSKWYDKFPIGKDSGTPIHIWSVATMIAAIAMMPAMLEVGEGNGMQFLGFFAPLYLILVSLTPEWETSGKQHKVHMAAAYTCAVVAYLWMIFVCHLWWLVLIVAALVIAFAVWKKLTWAYIFWGEVIMFVSVYITMLIR